MKRRRGEYSEDHGVPLGWPAQVCRKRLTCGTGALSPPSLDRFVAAVFFVCCILLHSVASDFKVSAEGSLRLQRSQIDQASRSQRRRRRTGRGRTGVGYGSGGAGPAGLRHF